MNADYTDIVFDGPPGPECGRFVEVEDSSGASISIGEWVERDDGYWCLRLPINAHLIAAAPELLAALETIASAMRADGDLVSLQMDYVEAQTIHNALAKARGDA